MTKKQKEILKRVSYYTEAETDFDRAMQQTDVRSFGGAIYITAEGKGGSWMEGIN
jgi:hypothetical protein